MVFNRWFVSLFFEKPLLLIVNLYNVKNFFTYIFTFNLLLLVSFANAQIQGECTVPPAPKITNDEIIICKSDSIKFKEIEIIGQNIKWYSSETSTVPLDSFQIVTPGIYYATQTFVTNDNYFCESKQRLEVKVLSSIIKIPKIKLEDNVFCAVSKKQLKDIIFEYPKDLSYGNKLLFFDKNGRSIPSNSMIEQQQNYNVQYFDGYCFSDKLNFRIAMDEGDVLDGFIAIQKCAIEGASLQDIQLNYSNVNWYANQYDTLKISSSQLLTTSNYYYSTTNIRGCESVTRSKVIVTIDKGIVPISLNRKQQICESKSLVFSALSVTPYSLGSIYWYETDKMSSKPFSSNDPIENNKIYWASFKSNTTIGCESIERIPVVVNVVSSIDVLFDISPTVICSGATISNLPLISTNGIKGKWSPPLNNQQTTTYTFTPVAGQCAVNNQLTITVNPTPSSDFVLPSILPIQTKSFQLIPTVKSGKFIGNGVIGDFFYPSKVGFGFHRITYNKSSLEGCKSTTTKSTLVCDTIGGTYFDTVVVKKYIYDTVEIKKYITIYDTLIIKKTVYDTLRTYVTLYDTISVTDTLKIKLIVTTGISDKTENLIRVFPNPTNGVLFIDNGDFLIMKNYTNQLTDLQGKVLFNEVVSSQRSEIDLKNLKKGIYLLNIFDANGKLTASKKIVLE